MIAPSHTPHPCSVRTLRLAIDVGHSKTDPGAISATGKSEYEFNKRFADELINRSKEFRALQMFVLQSGNELKSRPNEAAHRGADVFLSIHHDSVNRKYMQLWQYQGRWRQHSDVFKGFSLFVWEHGKHFKSSLAVATLVGKNLQSAGFSATLHHAEPIAGENRLLLNRELGIYAAPFAVLRHASMPAVLFEVGIIANRSEEKELEDPTVRAKVQIELLKALTKYAAIATTSKDTGCPAK